MAVTSMKRQVQLARGIIFSNDSVLLVQDVKGKGHFFLPGGHIEVGESAVSALTREIQEELGWKVEAGPFVGCLENRWDYTRKRDQQHIEVFELNLLFLVNANEKLLRSTPVSKEDHIAFKWVPFKELSDAFILPPVTKDIIVKLRESGSAFKSIWESTL
ncbi:MAG: NUDIX domain-containing protein [Oligoflexales bacterium]